MSFGKGSGRHGGGGLRREITEFSRASRRRLLRTLNSINRDKVDLPYFITLTYPDSALPESRQRRKAHIDAFFKRLERLVGWFPAVWRLEFKDRKSGLYVGEVVPHFHMLAFLPQTREVGSLLWLKVKELWFEVIGFDGGLDQGPSAHKWCEPARSWRGVNSYASKYMGKLEQLKPGQESPGRFWGVRRRNLLPIEAVSTGIGLKDAIKIRRVFRRLSGVRHRNTRDLQAASCYVSFGTSNRLLSWLGYYRP